MFIGKTLTIDLVTSKTVTNKKWIKQSNYNNLLWLYKIWVCLHRGSNLALFNTWRADVIRVCLLGGRGGEGGKSIISLI